MLVSVSAASVILIMHLSPSLRYLSSNSLHVSQGASVSVSGNSLAAILYICSGLSAFRQFLNLPSGSFLVAILL